MDSEIRPESPAPESIALSLRKSRRVVAIAYITPKNRCLLFSSNTVGQAYPVRELAIDEVLGPSDLHRATILLPVGYDEHPQQYYPVIYKQNHFSLEPPISIRTEPPASDSAEEKAEY